MHSFAIMKEFSEIGMARSCRVLGIGTTRIFESEYINFILDRYPRVQIPKTNTKIGARGEMKI